MTARMRPAAAIGTAALLLALLPGSASAQQASNRGIDDACPSAASDAFDDDEASVHEEAIDCIALWEIVQGVGGGEYNPGGDVARDAMATFIANTMVVAGHSFDSSPPDAFDDDEASVHEANINRLADAGVVEGVSADRYDPTRLVTRDQMAKFVVRALEVASGTNVSTSEDFFDDDEGNTFESFINELASIQVVTGTGGRNYSPGRDVDRASMGSFVARGGDYLADEHGDWPRAFVTVDDDTLAAGEDVTGEIGAVSDDNGVVTARVSGCGLSNELAEDDDTTRAGIQFSEQIPASQDEGACTLTFTVDMQEGADETVAVTITVTEPAAAEAADGEHTSVDVVSVNRSGNSFVGTGDTQNHGTERFLYDSNDQFRFLDGDTTETITLAQFQGLLTGPESSETDGDVLNVDYDDDASGTSTFTVTTDNVPPSPDVVAEVIDADGDGTRDDVRITWSPSVQPDAVYDVFRDDPTTDDDEINPVVDTEVASDEDATTVTVNDQPDGTYNYLVRAESPTSVSQSEEAASDDVTVPGEADGGAASENLVQTTVAGTAATADNGDVWRFAFDAPLAAPEDGDEIALVEGDDASQNPIGTAQGNAEEETTVTHGTNATFASNGSAVTINGVSYPAGTVLTVTLTAVLAPDQMLPNGDGNITYPLTVTGSSAVTGTSGDEVDWASSFDRRVESDATRPQSQTLTANDADDSDTVTDGDTIVVDFGEDMRDAADEPRPDAFTVTDAGDDSVTLTHGGNATFRYSDATPEDAAAGIRRLAITVETNATAVSYGSGTTVTAHVYVTDAAGNGWNLAAGDRSVDEAGAGPSMTGATGDGTTALTADEITVTHSEPVTCNGNAPSQFVHDPDPTAADDETAANGIECDGTNTVTLTFPNGTYEDRDGDTITYTQSPTPANRVEASSDGRDAQSPQTVDVDPDASGS
ncbi:MAG: S-layer homology domain-containing protein [Nitriliruptorales bacterium]